MKNSLFRNEKGLTIAELLATIAIASILVIFITSIIVIVQKQYTFHKDDAQHLTDITIAAKVITKDIRTHSIQYVIPNESIEFIDGNNYEFDAENNVLKRNGADYIYEIKKFEIDAGRNPENESEIIKVYLKIESMSGQEIDTEIIVR